MDEILIQAQGLGKTVATNNDAQQNTSLTILNNVSLAIAAGESVAITGSSGSGKSTLLALLAGLDIPTSGSVQLFGQALERLNEDQRAALRLGRVGFVFQSFQLLDHLTALENVVLPLELGRAEGDLRQRAEQALAQVGLSQRTNQWVNRLSGGEQQRVALARAFVTQPQVLFADEPTGNLDRATGHEISDLLFRLQHDYQTTLVLVTHDESLAARCQNWYRLVDGHLELQAPSMDRGAA